MAKIKLGQAIAQASGSVGGTVFSHNRFGAYIRNRSIPVQPESGPQLSMRAAFAAGSAQWSALTAAIRKAWLVWAQNNPIVDSLGDKRILDGHQAYTMLATRLTHMGLGMPTTPPIIGAPVALSTLSVTASAATQNTDITFTPTPTSATHRIWLVACKTPTPTVNYVKNLLRFIDKSGASATSPLLVGSIPLILGAFTAGENLIVRCSIVDHTTGLLSVPLEARCIIAA